MSIIIKPVVTEKMTAMADKLNRYAFIVDVRANKLQIKEAVEKFYDVKVQSVNTINQLGKKKSRYTRAGFITGRKPSTKKALVTLAKGDSIDFYSNI